MLIINSCMDTHNDIRMASDQVRAELARYRVVVGAKQLRKALQSGRAQKVYLAENADPAITEPLVALCQLHRVTYAWVKSMADLGNICGIEVGAAAAAAVL